MSRFLLPALVVLAVAAPARADRMAPVNSPAERALRVPVVVVGKVTAFEKDAVELFPYPGATAKVEHSDDLSAEVILAQVRSIIADLLALCGMDPLEATAVIPLR